MNSSDTRSKKTTRKWASVSGQKKKVWHWLISNSTDWLVTGSYAKAAVGHKKWSQENIICLYAQWRQPISPKVQLFPHDVVQPSPFVGFGSFWPTQGPRLTWSVAHVSSWPLRWRGSKVQARPQEVESDQAMTIHCLHLPRPFQSDSCPWAPLGPALELRESGLRFRCQSSRSWVATRGCSTTTYWPPGRTVRSGRAGRRPGFVLELHGLNDHLMNWSCLGRRKTRCSLCRANVRDPLPTTPRGLVEALSPIISAISRWNGPSGILSLPVCPLWSSTCLKLDRRDFHLLSTVVPLISNPWRTISSAISDIALTRDTFFLLNGKCGGKWISHMC